MIPNTPGLIAAFETHFPASERQRCVIHYAEWRIMWMSARNCLSEAGFGLCLTA